jgi:hypothetical protein
MRLDDWLFIFWINLNWLSLQTLLSFFLFLKWCSSTIGNQWIYQSGLLRRPQSDAKRCECLKRILKFQFWTLQWCPILFCLFLEIEIKCIMIAVLWWCGRRSAVKCNTCPAKVWSGFILEWNKAIYLSVSVELLLFASSYCKYWLLVDSITVVLRMYMM